MQHQIISYYYTVGNNARRIKKSELKSAAAETLQAAAGMRFCIFTRGTKRHHSLLFLRRTHYRPPPIAGVQSAAALCFFYQHCAIFPGARGHRRRLSTGTVFFWGAPPPSLQKFFQKRLKT